VGDLDQPVPAVHWRASNENFELEELISGGTESRTMTADDFVA